MTSLLSSDFERSFIPYVREGGCIDIPLLKQAIDHANNQWGHMYAQQSWPFHNLVISYYQSHYPRPLPHPYPITITHHYDKDGDTMMMEAPVRCSLNAPPAENDPSLLSVAEPEWGIA